MKNRIAVALALALAASFARPLAASPGGNVPQSSRVTVTGRILQLESSNLTLEGDQLVFLDSGTTGGRNLHRGDRVKVTGTRLAGGNINAKSVTILPTNVASDTKK